MPLTLSVEDDTILAWHNLGNSISSHVQRTPTSPLCADTHGRHCNDAVELLPQVGGLILALEHRYYGESVPAEDLDTENLRWLSSKQALADIAHFHAFISEKYARCEAEPAFSLHCPIQLHAAFLRSRVPHVCKTIMCAAIFFCAVPPLICSQLTNATTRRTRV